MVYILLWNNNLPPLYLIFKIYYYINYINLNKSQIIPFNKLNEILQKYEIQLMNKFWEDTSTMKTGIFN